MPANLENSAVAIGLEKVSFHSNTKERQCQRIVWIQTTTQFHLSSTYFMLAKKCSKFFKPGFNSMLTVNFQVYYKLDLENTEEPVNKLPTSIGSSKKQESSRKTSTSALMTTQSLCVDHNKLWKILKEMGIPDHLTCLLRNLYAGQ